MRWRAEYASLACILLTASVGCVTTPPPAPAPVNEPRAGAEQRQVIATGRVRVLLAHGAASARAVEAASGMAPDAPDERDAIATAEIERALGVVSHPAVSALALALEERIGQSCDAPPSWRVIVLDVHDEANAMSLPSGQVFVTAALIATTRDEAELASVVAHELGHVIAKHARSHELMRRGLAAASVQGMDSGPGPTGRVSSVTRFGGAVVLGEHGRLQELEADRIAAQCLALAGYDPDALIDLIDRQRGADRRVLGGLDRSHPGEAKRARALRRARAEGIFAPGGDRGDSARHAIAREVIEALARERK